MSGRSEGKEREEGGEVRWGEGDQGVLLCGIRPKLTMNTRRRCESYTSNTLNRSFDQLLVFNAWSAGTVISTGEPHQLPDHVTAVFMQLLVFVCWLLSVPAT